GERKARRQAHGCPDQRTRRHMVRHPRHGRQPPENIGVHRGPNRQDNGDENRKSPGVHDRRNDPVWVRDLLLKPGSLPRFFSALEPAPTSVSRARRGVQKAERRSEQRAGVETRSKPPGYFLSSGALPAALLAKASMTAPKTRSTTPQIRLMLMPREHL